MTGSPIDRRIVSVIFASVALFCTAVVFFTDMTGKDYNVYMRGSAAIINHRTIYDPSAASIPFAAPPTIAWVMLPLTHVPDWLAAKIWIGLSLVCLLGSLAIARIHIMGGISLRHFGLILLGFLVLFPTRFTLILGQINLITLFLIVFAYSLQTKSETHPILNQILSGSVLALATGIKIIPIVLLPYLIIKKHWIAASTYFLSCIAILGGTIQYFRISQDEMLTLVGRMIVPMFLLPDTHAMAISNTQYNQSLSSILSVFIKNPSVKTVVALGIVSILGITAAIVWDRIRKQNRTASAEADWYLFSSLLALGTLGANGTVWVHHLVFLYPLFWLYLVRIIRARNTLQILPALIIGVMFYISPFHFVAIQPGFIFRYYGLWVFLYVYSYLSVAMIKERRSIKSPKKSYVLHMAEDM